MNQYEQMRASIEFFLEKEAAEYQGKDVKLGKPAKGDVKKYKVYVDENKDGKAEKVNFGDKNMRNNRDKEENRKDFRSRHNCKDKKDRSTPGYWSCKMWSKKPVKDMMKSSAEKIRERVEAILYNSKGKVLMGTASFGKRMFPGGGIDKGETPAQAAKREALEEAGLAANNMKPIGKPLQIMEATKGKYDGSKTYLVAGKIDAKNMSMYNAEGDGLKGLKLHSIPDVISEMKQRIGNQKSVYDEADKQRISALKDLRKKLKV